VFSLGRQGPLNLDDGFQVTQAIGGNQSVIQTVVQCSRGQGAAYIEGMHMHTTRHMPYINFKRSANFP